MAGDKEVLVQLRDVKKEFVTAKTWAGKPLKVVHAVDQVNLSIYKGETIGVVGESWCGKSTLGRCLLRLEDITGGTVCFQGEDITHYSGSKLMPLRRNMQMIFQNPYASFDPKQRIGSALMEVAAVHKLPAKQAQEKILSLLHAINLPEDTLLRIPS